MNAIKKTLSNFGLTRIIIIAFIAVIFVCAIFQGQDMAALISDSLVRVGQNLLLTLSMLPMMLVGSGLNMGLAFGLCTGILGGLISIEMGLTGLVGLLAAVAFSIPFSAIAGYGYGKLLNMRKGSEMLIGNYVGSSFIYLMCMFWIGAPFKSPTIIFPIGGTGVRTSVSVSEYYEKVLNKLLAFQIGEVVIPTGLFLFILIVCLLLHVYIKSRAGLEMRVVGNNPDYAASIGLNINKTKVKGIVLSTVIAAIGIVVYTQSYGFYQAYEGPLQMAFTPMAAILLGGATLKNVKISHAVLGTFLFQTLLTISLPVFNVVFPESSLSEVFRIIISNGIILYALAQAGGETR